MKLTVASEKKNQVEISTEVDCDGDALVKANGVKLLWVTQSGEILMNLGDDKGLEELGFVLDESGCGVAVCR